MLELPESGPDGTEYPSKGVFQEIVPIEKIVTTDEFGMHVAENPVHVHDFHATILHLLGIDHEKLTYRHAGRDFRLTDVHGNVIREILA